MTQAAEPALIEARPDVTTGWRVVGASVPGAKRSEGESCEDFHSWTVVDDLLIAAVADGAGSAEFAAEGSRLAASFVVEHLAWVLAEGAAPDENTLADAFSATRRALARRASLTGRALAELATTLCVAVAVDTELTVAQVGDGAAVVGGPDGRLRSVASTAKGEYLNETTFLTSRAWESELTTERFVGEYRDLALMTDGLSLVALDLATDSPHPPFFEPIFAFARSESAEEEALDRFLRSGRVAARTDDDVTLLVATI